MAAVSVDENSQDVITATMGPGPGAVLSDAEIKTAVNSTLRSRGKLNTAMSTRTALGSSSTGKGGISYEKMVSAFSAVTISYFLLAINLYVEAAVSLFHLAYFTYRNPKVSKDLMKTAYHLLKTSYDNKLLTAGEIVKTTKDCIIAPMARQNKKVHEEENLRTAQLQTMRTSSAASR